MHDDNYRPTDLISGEPYEPMKEPRFTGIATFMRAPLASSLDVLLARVRAAVAAGGQLREDSLPDLRAGYEQLAGDHPDPDLLAELDELVDAANSLATAVSDSG